jgi:hypothetical protein
VNFTVASRVETAESVEPPPSVGVVGSPPGVAGLSEGFGSVVPGRVEDAELSAVGVELELELGDGDVDPLGVAVLPVVLDEGEADEAGGTVPCLCCSTTVVASRYCSTG